MDLSLVRKWEQGTRKRAEEEVTVLAKALQVEPKPMLIDWYTEKVLYELLDSDLANDVMKAAEAQVAYRLFACSDQEALVRLLKRVPQQFPRERKASVFGFFARKDDRAGSHIDLAIKADKGFN